MRFFKTMMLCASFLLPCFAWAQEVPVHSLSMRVLVDGKEIMTPNLQVLSDVPAYASYTAKGQTEPTYSLQVIVSPGLNVGGISGTAVEASLWEGAFKQTKPIVDSAILLVKAAGKDLRGPQSLELIDEKGLAYEIQVVSYGVFMKDASTLPAKQTSCLTVDGKINGLVKAAPMANIAPALKANGCCGGPCGNGGGSMQCCGAISCCVCGTCCTTPEG
jgi:hypothetical protein